MPDIMNIEILEDGTISVDTDNISEQQHLSADEFLISIEEFSGGTKTMKQKEHPFMKNKKVLRGGKIIHSKV